MERRTAAGLRSLSFAGPSMTTRRPHDQRTGRRPRGKVKKGSAAFQDRQLSAFLPATSRATMRHWGRGFGRFPEAPTFMPGLDGSS
jgi:hypothetical protein